MTVRAKSIIEAYYGERPRHSYFASCSNGGRQALMEAQRYPADYDGIIAGAPANARTSIFAGFLWDTQALSGPASFIPPSKLPAIERAVLTACDARDGVKDSVLEDPRQCRFDPATIVCKAGDKADCLTSPQAEALRKIYSGPHDPAGKPLISGFEPGGQTGAGGWRGWILGDAPGKSAQAIFGTQFMANMVFNDPEWDYRNFDFDHDMKTANDRMAKILNATDPDLNAFRSRGGKLILFHGWADPALPPLNTINYFNAVKTTLGAETADSFIRLYMMPGTQHCLGGPGPNYCGGLSAAQGDPEHDFSAALERWVENGVAPRRMIASKFANDADLASGVIRTRPLCPFPETAVYKGSGSTDDAANFVCQNQR
jgi:feruloyl esterase